MRVVGRVEHDVVTSLAAVERLVSLENVLAWCHARSADLLDVIVQDEFTHDVIVRATPAFLCFDTT